MTLDSVADSRLSFGGSVGRADWVSDEEWARIGPLLPAEWGRGCRPAQDNRRYFEGRMWMARTGAQWPHLPDA
ncbi:transposase [Mesorhizobium sp. AR10]|uniref:transposase n=1 Tax=Mesorhizobium sp. AR10 TaxID=2865839 RepID=UPI0039B6EB77